MRVEYRPECLSGTHIVRLDSNGYDWFYPSALKAEDCCSYYGDNTQNYYGKPPSAELRSLIEAGAPWYAVMDKLSEEYPQWQHHFDEVIRRHQAEQPAGEPQPQEGG